MESLEAFSLIRASRQRVSTPACSNVLAVFRLLTGSPSLEGVFVLAALVARWAELRAREGGRARVRVDTSGAMAVNDGDDADENAVVLLSDGSSDDAAGNATADEDEDAAYAAGGGTDEEVPDGENYFGRAAKEGAAPEGANPFASAPAAEDDWASQIAEAKRQVEEQRVKREKEEALEREKEAAAAELAGKKFVARRKAGDPPPRTTPSATAAAPRARRVLKARRPGGAQTRTDVVRPRAPGRVLGVLLPSRRTPRGDTQTLRRILTPEPGRDVRVHLPGGLAPVAEEKTRRHRRRPSSADSAERPRRSSSRKKRNTSENRTARTTTRRARRRRRRPRSARRRFRDSRASPRRPSRRRRRRKPRWR